MEYFKKIFIYNSKYGKYYYDIFYENCLYDCSNKQLVNTIFNIIIYGNINSHCKKNISLHSRLNTLSEYDKHQIACEYDKIQRLNFHFHKIIFFCLFINLLILFMRHYLFFTTSF